MPAFRRRGNRRAVDAVHPVPRRVPQRFKRGLLRKGSVHGISANFHILRHGFPRRRRRRWGWRWAWRWRRVRCRRRANPTRRDGVRDVHAVLQKFGIGGNGNLPRRPGHGNDVVRYGSFRPRTDGKFCSRADSASIGDRYLAAADDHFCIRADGGAALNLNRAVRPRRDCLGRVHVAGYAFRRQNHIPSKGFLRSQTIFHDLHRHSTLLQQLAHQSTGEC